MKDVFSTEFAGRTISLKANYVAAQADGAILATYGDTVVSGNGGVFEKRPGRD